MKLEARRLYRTSMAIYQSRGLLLPFEFKLAACSFETTSLCTIHVFMEQPNNNTVTEIEKLRLKLHI